MADQAGDTRILDDPYLLQGYDSDPSIDDPRIYKFTYPLLMEAQIRKLKLSLESWREVVLPVQSVLLWERQWHPTALIGGSTIAFTLLWLLEPSILTVISMLGLGLTICDYLMPSLAGAVFKAEKWTAKKEREFESLCTSLILYKAKLELAWGSYHRMKTTNRKMYYIGTIAVLCLLAWAGCTFNNLFLLYVTVTVLLLLPGMEHTGMGGRICSVIQNFIASILNQSAAKIGQEKKQE